MSGTAIPLAGVIGDPIAHSKSPRLHGYWLKRYDIAGYYVPLHVPPDDLVSALRYLPRFGFVGVNVTLPHKERVLEIADVRTPEAERIGAANTLTFGSDGRITAENTDAYGFAENLRHSAPGWSPDAPAAVFGAGGAARAVVAGLLALGHKEIRLSNRTLSRAETVAAAFGSSIRVVPWAESAEMVAGAGLVVNTTSLGMHGQAPFPAVLDRLTPGTVAADIVYIPLETPFLEMARARGAICVDGLGMLLHQGIPGFQRWFGRKPEITEELRAVMLR